MSLDGASMFTVQKVIAIYVNCTFIREKTNNGGKFRIFPYINYF